jgi:hypothetical protein
MPSQQNWIDNLSPFEQELAQNLPLRRDMVTLLTYLRDHRVIGTQASGNLPLKAIREVTAGFVHPPVLDSTIGEHTHHLRSEDDVWPLLFIHLLANYGSLLEGGRSRRWLMTNEGERFLEYPPGTQIAFLTSIWWKKMDWVIAFPYEGLSKGLPPRFKDTTRIYLQELPVETRIPVDEFADELIARTGLTWRAEVESAQTILRRAIYRMVVYVLDYFGMAEIKYRDDKHAAIVSNFTMTVFGRKLLDGME